MRKAALSADKHTYLWCGAASRQTDLVTYFSSADQNKKINYLTVENKVLLMLYLLDILCMSIVGILGS